jgi:hypothetical protein
MSPACPSRKEPTSKAFCKLQTLLLGLLLLQSSGCAVLQIPSYRVESQSTEVHEGLSDDCDEVVEHELAEDTMDQIHWPTLPTPKFIKRWKEHKDLPEGPQGIRFHPLPTRPMFQPRPTPLHQPEAELTNPACEAGVNYGALPQGQHWHPSKQSLQVPIEGEPAQTIESDNQGSGQQLQPSPALRSLLNSSPSSADELPKPEDSR